VKENYAVASSTGLGGNGPGNHARIKQKFLLIRGKRIGRKRRKKRSIYVPRDFYVPGAKKEAEKTRKEIPSMVERKKSERKKRKGF